MQTHLLHTAAASRHMSCCPQNSIRTVDNINFGTTLNANQEHCICKHNNPLLSAASKACTHVCGLLYSVFSVLQIQAWTVS